MAGWLLQQSWWIDWVVFQIIFKCSLNKVDCMIYIFLMIFTTYIYIWFWSRCSPVPVAKTSKNSHSHNTIVCISYGILYPALPRHSVFYCLLLLRLVLNRSWHTVCNQHAAVCSILFSRLFPRQTCKMNKLNAVDVVQIYFFLHKI